MVFGAIQVPGLDTKKRETWKIRIEILSWDLLLRVTRDGFIDGFRMKGMDFQKSELVPWELMKLPLKMESISMQRKFFSNGKKHPCFL